MVAKGEEREKALVEARAWILWGKPLDDVERRLRIAGFDREEAATFMKGVLEERAARFRRAGIRDVLLGVGLLPGGGIWLAAGGAFMGIVTAGYGAVAVVAGLWWLWRGLDRIHRGARVEGSITDL